LQAVTTTDSVGRMLSYYLRLSLRSFARTPALTALMALAMALGIAACVITLTVHSAMSVNPIPEKSGRLFTVTLDSWDPNRPVDEDKPELPPTQLTWQDATHLFTSPVPERKVMMYPVPGVLVGTTGNQRPVRARTRVTTSDFFGMFDVPFQFGGGWSTAADNGPEPFIVLSRRMNDRLFGGDNSVGRTVRWNDREFRVVGVLGDWLPLPRYYDLNGAHFAEPEEAFIPWGWGRALELLSSGNILCWKSEKVDTFQDLAASECNWVQMWVELPDAAARERMQATMDAYWTQQRGFGRFQRPQNNRLTDVPTWLDQRGVVQSDNQLLVVLSFVFFAICLVNTVGLLLAKFLNSAGIAGIRRVLGASRREVVTQHLVEAGVLASAGAVMGLLLGVLGLWSVRLLYANAPGERGGYEALARFDVGSLVWVMALAIVAALAAGLYPAWRISRLNLTAWVAP
jgi:putative ABC transport system permease protein